MVLWCSWLSHLSNMRCCSILDGTIFAALSPIFIDGTGRPVQHGSTLELLDQMGLRACPRGVSSEASSIQHVMLCRLREGAPGTVQEPHAKLRYHICGATMCGCPTSGKLWDSVSPHHVEEEEVLHVQDGLYVCRPSTNTMASSPHGGQYISCCATSCH